MRPRAILAAGLLALAASSASAQGIDMATVDIIDVPRPLERWGYAPRAQRVAPGSWVTWSNAGQDAHSVTALDGSFDSLELQPSEGFSWYFDSSGTFEYFCTLHDWMLGSVIVDEPASEAPPIEEVPAEDPQ